jgi:hypothetical protein
MTTYKVRFSEEARDYRIRILALLDKIEICEFPDETVFVKCEDEATAMAVEYELRKAERRDDFCDWEKIS